MTAAHPPGVVPAEPGRRGILAVLTLVHAAGSANLMAVLAMGPIVQQALQLSRSEFGLMVAAYSGGLLICAIPFGWVVDRFGAERMARDVANMLEEVVA